MAKSIKTITIISFSLVLAALLTAIVSDVAIFSQQILTFIAAIFISAIVFLFAIVLMIVSIMLVFGVIVLKNDGFWPLAWTKTTFIEILSDNHLTTEQISNMTTIRIVLLIVSAIILILSTIALAMMKRLRKKDPEYNPKSIEYLGIASTILSSLGVIVSLGAVVILSFLK